MSAPRTRGGEKYSNTQLKPGGELPEYASRYGAKGLAWFKAEAGEGGKFFITLANVGVSGTTAVSATLTSSTSSITMLQPNTIAYPNIAANAMAVNATPFLFTVASNLVKEHALIERRRSSRSIEMTDPLVAEKLVDEPDYGADTDTVAL